MDAKTYFTECYLTINLFASCFYIHFKPTLILQLQMFTLTRIACMEHINASVSLLKETRLLCKTELLSLLCLLKLQ